MKFITKMKKRVVALSMALSLGLALSASTGPVYGSTTVSISTGGNTTQKATFVSAVWRLATTLFVVAALQRAADALRGTAGSPTSAAYPSNALDR